MPPIPNARAALVVAHPSHELRVHGWLQKARPRVFILTDGGGRAGEPRIAATTKVLEQVGAEPGLIYGRLADLEVYAALLRQDLALFTGLADELAEALAQDETEYVVGDSAEGYSSVHDVCRLLIDAAVEIASRRYGRTIQNFDFAVVGPPDDHCKTGDDAIWLHLDDGMFLRKIAAAHDYSPTLAADVEAALGGKTFDGIRRLLEPKLVDQTTEVIRTEINARAELDGVEIGAYRTECLRPLSNDRLGADWSVTQAFYEVYGERMVATGHYQHVIRYHEHVRPVADALRAHSARSF